MYNLYEYVLKSGVSLAVLYFFYWLFLRKDTHFRLNRMVLLFSVIISLILPFVKFSSPVNTELIPAFNINYDEVSISVKSEGSKWNVWQLIPIIYFIGMGIVFCRLIYQGIYLHVISKLSKTVKFNELTIVLMNTEISPFSYFNKIFIPFSKNDEFSINSIVEHEKSHKRQYHFIDLFIIEAITIIQWFNPFVWLYEKSIKEVHEYLADEDVLNHGYNKGKYQALLVNEAMGGPVFSLTSRFNHSLTKKRILMMKKMKSSYFTQLKALIFVPLIAGLLIAFANPGNSAILFTPGKQSVITGKVTDKLTGNPYSGVLVLLENTNIGTITNSEGNYRIEIPVEKTSILAFSHMGLKTERIAIANKKVVNVEMEDEIISINPSIISNEERTKKGTAKNNFDSANYIKTEMPPYYSGGMSGLKKYLSESIKYPADAQNNQTEGTVYVQLTISEKGHIKDAIVIRSVDPLLDKEALRVINSMSGWKPATNNGKAVESKITLPVEFKLK